MSRVAFVACVLLAGCGSELEWSVTPLAGRDAPLRWMVTEGECGTGGRVLASGTTGAGPSMLPILDPGRYCFAAFDLEIEAPARCRLMGVALQTVSLPRDRGALALALRDVAASERSAYDGYVDTLAGVGLGCAPDCDPERCPCGSSERCQRTRACPAPIRSSEVVASESHVCALAHETLEDGRLGSAVYCWGDRGGWSTDSGPDPTPRPELVPFDLGAGSTIESLAAGAGVTCALGSRGEAGGPTAQCFGRDPRRALAGSTRATAVAFDRNDPPALCVAFIQGGVGGTPLQHGLRCDAASGSREWALPVRAQQIGFGEQVACALFGDQLGCWGQFRDVEERAVGTYSAVHVLDDLTCAVATSGSATCWRSASGPPGSPTHAPIPFQPTPAPIAEVLLAPDHFAVRTSTGRWLGGTRSGDAFGATVTIEYPDGLASGLVPEDVALTATSRVLGGERVVVTDLSGRVRADPMGGLGNTSAGVDAVCPP